MEVTKWSAFVIKVGVLYMGVHVSRHLEEELAWATDNNLKQLYH